jgi:hypothetical protein
MYLFTQFMRYIPFLKVTFRFRRCFYVEKKELSSYMLIEKDFPSISYVFEFWFIIK